MKNLFNECEVIYKIRHDWNLPTDLQRTTVVGFIENITIVIPMKIKIGVAIKSLDDNFNKKVGKLVAFRRAISKDKAISFNVPLDVNVHEFLHKKMREVKQTYDEVAYLNSIVDIDRLSYDDIVKIAEENTKSIE